MILKIKFYFTSIFNHVFLLKSKINIEPSLVLFLGKDYHNKTQCPMPDSVCHESVSKN